MAVEGICYGVIGTYGKAVEAHHAAAHVGHVVIEVDAFRFANVGAFAALNAPVCVDVDVERRAACKVSEQSAYGAESVAKHSSTA